MEKNIPHRPEHYHTPQPVIKVADIDAVIATQNEIVSPEELQRRFAALFV